MEDAWPIMMNGFSTGFPPIHVNTIRLATNNQNNVWVIGRNVSVRCFDVCSRGKINNTKMESSRASTPPNLLGIDRRIA